MMKCQLHSNWVAIYVCANSSRSYFASIVVNMKDQLVELVKILMTFITIDLSNNFILAQSLTIESVALFNKLWVT
ncbi:hypothetical protein AHAS_Ahas17G0187000 [Arachis hypogaea]